MLSKDMKRAEKRPDWVDLVPAERTPLDRLVPRRSTLRSDRRPGNRAASASRSPFLRECQGTERSFNAPPHPQDSVGVYMNCQVTARLVLRRNCFGVVGPTRAMRLSVRVRSVNRTGRKLLPSFCDAERH